MDAMNRSILALALLAVLPVSSSGGITAGVDGTTGSNGYRGLKAKASVDLNDSVYLTPSLATYRTDESSGAYNRAGLRLGYESGPVALGAQAAFQPKHNGYRQTLVGADVTFSVTPGGSKKGRKMAGPSSGGGGAFGSGLAGVDVGAAFTHIRHTDDFAGSGTGSGARRSGARRATAFTIGQSDLTVFGGAKFLVAEVSAEATKSVYDKNLDENGARSSQLLSLPGVSSLQQGFPDRSFNVMAKLKVLPMVRPYASYTRTSFKLGEAPSSAYELGGTLGLELVSVKAAYERYVQRGFPSRNYFTLGASVYF
jgi:hypothetical protein